jgi:prepilin-type N-terminal cleavage/methylation domain-containing protein
MKKQAGLTLIEVLIGIFVLGLISMALAQVTWLTTKGARNLEQRAALYHTARVAMQRMREDLSMAFILKPTKSSVGRDISKFKTGFIGETDTVTLTTLSGRRYIADEIAADQREVSYAVERLEDYPDFEPFPFGENVMQLKRREDKSLDDDIAEGGESVTLVEGIVKLELKYWDSDEGDWVDSWDSTQRAKENKLPGAVQISLYFPNPADPETREPLLFRTVALMGLGPDPIDL